jgi:hypothetical protein
MPIPDIDTFRRVELGAVRSTDGDSGPLHAAVANAIHSTEIVLDYSLLNDTEAAQLIALWDGGEGLVNSFAISLPDESDDRLVVFADDAFSIMYANGRVRQGSFRLIDVTPAGTF